MQLLLIKSLISFYLFLLRLCESKNFIFISFTVFCELSISELNYKISFVIRPTNSSWIIKSGILMIKNSLKI
jgi:hypothetical protein